MLVSTLLLQLGLVVAPDLAHAPAVARADEMVHAEQGKGDQGKKKPASPTKPAKPESKPAEKPIATKDGPSAESLEAMLVARGLVMGADGDWLDADEQQKLKDGWTRQDLEWVRPQDADQVKQGLWKCGDAWLTLDQANEYHSKIGQWWRLRGKNFDVYSTCTRSLALRALALADWTAKPLQKIFGRTPPARPIVLVLNASDQYNTFATGDGRSSPDLRGLSSSHGAFFAELWDEPLKHGYSGSGVCYWDQTAENDKAFGPYYVRHAAGQSFAEALDPSPKTLATASAKKPGADLAKAFWDEKQLPQWFRYGAASYVERYCADDNAKDPKELLRWSVTNITNKGGLDPLAKIFAFERDSNAAGDGKLMNECGLLVAFVVDGGVKDLEAKHAALTAALKSGKNVDKAATALEEELTKSESKLREFAGL